jgi:hypothetical protein
MPAFAPSERSEDCAGLAYVADPPDASDSPDGANLTLVTVYAPDGGGALEIIDVLADEVVGVVDVLDGTICVFVLVVIVTGNNDVVKYLIPERKSAGPSSKIWLGSSQHEIPAKLSLKMYPMLKSTSGKQQYVV